MASIFLYFYSFVWIAAVQTFLTLLARDSAIPGLTTPQINAFTPYTYYAKAVYCEPPTIMTWTCGVACAGNKGFKPLAAGGDGDGVQYWFVGYDANLTTIIVAHQGTNISHFKALLTDGDLGKSKLDSSLFPGLPLDIQVHRGFQDEHAKTALTILNNVQLAMFKYNVSSVTMVGHSLGAALALLDAVYLPLHLPKSTTFQSIVYGLPRVGNQGFANYVDANVKLTHVNNLRDPIPIVPGMFLGYVHPVGEVHIEANGKWAACPDLIPPFSPFGEKKGQDNPSSECIVGTVHNIFDCDEANHDGPYNGIPMHCNT